MSRVVLGTVVSPVGLNGRFKCNLMSYPPNWLDSGCKITINGVDHAVAVVQYPYNSRPNLCLCSIDQIQQRQEVASIVGLEIWIDRENLPEAKPGEFYCYDMHDFPIIYHGQVIGHFVRMHDFGGGHIIETDKGEYVHWNHVVKVNMDNEKGIYILDHALDE